jgi:hypothetical protein
VESENSPVPMSEETPKAGNFFNILGGVFFSPRETFEKLGPRSGITIPIIVVLILGSFSTFYLMKKVDLQASTRTQLEQSVEAGKITQEQMDQQLTIVTKLAPVIAIFGGVSSLILCLIFAGFGKLFSAIVGAVNQFKLLFIVTMYVLIAVTIVTTVLMIIILQLKQPGQMGLNDISSVLASNLGAVLEAILGMDALPKFVVSLAKVIDIFNIWTIALLSIGFSAVSKKLKTSTAATWLGTAYVLYSLIRIGIQAVTGA